MAPLKNKGLALIAISLLTAIPAHAQNQLEEVLVTAQKREKSILSVGMTMSVIDQSSIKSRNLLDLSDAAESLINVELFEDVAGAGIPTWVIRGVGLQDFNANNTPTASIYMDESYQTSSVMGAVGLFDIERVEVLKGPQGALYGRNTSGGAVLVNSARAKIGANTGSLMLTSGSWGYSGFEGVGNFSLTDKSALRLSTRVQSSNDAWQSSLVNNQHHGEKDLWDIRSWYAFEGDEGLYVDWKIQAGENNSEIGLGRSVGVYNSLGGICDALIQGYRDDDSCLSWSGLHLVLQGEENYNAVNLQSKDGSSTLSDPINKNSNDYISNVLIVKKQFANVELSSITTYDAYNYNVNLDLDGSSGEYAHRLSSSEIDVFSQEFRLVSMTDSALSWLAAVNINEERFEERRNFSFRENDLVSQSIGFSFGNVDYDQNTSSYSIYGTADYELNSRVNLTGSLRYTNEEKQYRNGNVYLPIEPPFYVYQNLSSNYKLDKNFSGSVGLNYDWRDNTFLYGSISSGFKSGGFYGGFPSFPEEIEPYLEESITAYELGFKSQHVNATLGINGAVFYYDYRDVQGFITKINELTNTQISVLSNQGDANHYGAELEMFWQVDSSLNLDVGLAYLSAEFDGEGALSSDIFGNMVPISGERSFAPKWSASIEMNYVFRVQENYSGIASLNYNYRTDRSGSRYSIPETAIYEFSAYGLLNGRVDFAKSQTGWSAAVWAVNILDESYVVNVKSDGLQGYMDMFGEPRSVGISLKYQWQ